MELTDTEVLFIYSYLNFYFKGVITLVKQELVIIVGDELDISISIKLPVEMGQVFGINPEDLQASTDLIKVIETSLIGYIEQVMKDSTKGKITPLTEYSGTSPPTKDGP